MMSIGTEVLSTKKENIAEILEETSLYDMVAQNDTTGESVMVLFEKSDINISTEYYLNNVKNGLVNLNLGYKANDTIETVKLCGSDYKVLTTTIPSYGLTQKYYTKKVDKYFVSILVTYFENTTDLNSIMSNFQ